MLDYAIAKEEGGVYLRLTTEQYSTLRPQSSDRASRYFFTQAI
jgi:hypothetical protein